MNWFHSGPVVGFGEYGSSSRFVTIVKGVVIGLVEANKPGCYNYSRGGEIVRCPWHGWEFDLRTGKSRFDPKRWKTHSYDIEVGDGKEMHAEIVDVSTEGDYVIVKF